MPYQQILRVLASGSFPFSVNSLISPVNSVNRFTQAFPDTLPFFPGDPSTYVRDVIVKRRSCGPTQQSLLSNVIQMIAGSHAREKNKKGKIIHSITFFVFRSFSLSFSSMITTTITNHVVVSNHSLSEQKRVTCHFSHQKRMR